MALVSAHRRASKTAIWLVVCGLALGTSSAVLKAQPPEASKPADMASPSEEPAVDAATSLPVSLARIKKDLARAETAPGLRGLNETPHFKVEVVEQARNWVPYFTGADFSSPTVPGGNYAYELQQVIFPKTRYPLAQPYAAFNGGELLTVSITTMLQQLLTPEVIKGVQAARAAHDRQAVRDELERALAEYCAQQPNGGQGVFGCK